MKHIGKALFFLLAVAAVLYAQSFGGRSTSDVFVLPPNRLCVGEDNGGQVCFKQTASGVASIVSGLLSGPITATSGSNITLLNYQSNGAQLTGNGAPQVVYSYTLLGGTVATGKGIRVSSASSHSVGSATITWTLTLNGVTVVNLGGATGNITAVIMAPSATHCRCAL